MKRLLALAVFAPAVAGAQPADTQPQPPAEKTLGIGYKLGNGIGVEGGDVIINPLPHLSIDLYGSFFQVKSSNGDEGTGYALAPAIQAYLKDGQRSTPYGAIGLQYATLTLDGISASGYGTFANIGYEWKWQSGFGIQLGGGVQYMQKVTATNGQTMLTTGGAVNPNLEFGLRYLFL
jgi:hypothetical protein